jgi:hypothetical protein
MLVIWKRELSNVTHRISSGSKKTYTQKSRSKLHTLANHLRTLSLEHDVTARQ